MKKGETEDYYYNEQDFKVFTEIYHIKRGYCCKSGCKHCPYNYDRKTDTFKKKQPSKKQERPK